MLISINVKIKRDIIDNYMPKTYLFEQMVYANAKCICYTDWSLKKVLWEIRLGRNRISDLTCMCFEYMGLYILDLDCDMIKYHMEKCKEVTKSRIYKSLLWFLYSNDELLFYIDNRLDSFLSSLFKINDWVN